MPNNFSWIINNIFWIYIIHIYIYIYYIRWLREIQHYLFECVCLIYYALNPLKHTWAFRFICWKCAWDVCFVCTNFHKQPMTFCLSGCTHTMHSNTKQNPITFFERSSYNPPQVYYKQVKTLYIDISGKFRNK